MLLSLATTACSIEWIERHCTQIRVFPNVETSSGPCHYSIHQLVFHFKAESCLRADGGSRIPKRFLSLTPQASAVAISPHPQIFTRLQSSPEHLRDMQAACTNTLRFSTEELSWQALPSPVARGATPQTSRWPLPSSLREIEPSSLACARRDFPRSSTDR